MCFLSNCNYRLTVPSELEGGRMYMPHSALTLKWNTRQSTGQGWGWGTMSSCSEFIPNVKFDRSRWMITSGRCLWVSCPNSKAPRGFPDSDTVAHHLDQCARGKKKNRTEAQSLKITDAWNKTMTCCLLKRLWKPRGALQFGPQLALSCRNSFQASIPETNCEWGHHSAAEYIHAESNPPCRVQNYFTHVYLRNVEVVHL